MHAKCRDGDHASTNTDTNTDTLILRVLHLSRVFCDHSLLKAVGAPFLVGNAFVFDYPRLPSCPLRDSGHLASFLNILVVGILLTCAAELRIVVATASSSCTLFEP